LYNLAVVAQMTLDKPGVCRKPSNGSVLVFQ